MRIIFFISISSFFMTACTLFTKEDTVILPPTPKEATLHTGTINEYIAQLETREKKVQDDSVGAKKAIQSWNDKDCRTITNQSLRSTCYDEILFTQIIQWDDINQCNSLTLPERISDCRDKISLQKARKNLSLPGCKDVINPILRDDCFVGNISYIVANGTAEKLESILFYCDELSQGKDVLCKAEIIDKLDRIYLTQSIKTKNWEICTTSLRKNDMQQKCLAYIEKMKK